MRLLIVGSGQPGAIENYYFKHLSQLVDKVEIFHALDIFQQYYQTNYINKVLFRTGISYIYPRINKSLNNRVHEFKPDVVWVFRGMEIAPDTLAYLKKLQIGLANFNPDHPFIYNRGTGNSNVINSIQHYDLHFCYNKQLMEHIRSQYGVKAVYLPFGFDLDDEEYNTIKKDELVERACFIGTYDKERHRIIKQLAEAGIKTDVYGNGWSGKINKHLSVRAFGAVHGIEFWQTIRKYKLQLNIYRNYNEGAHNQRTFEVPAAGGILLEPAGKHVHELFDSEREIFTYNGVSDMIKKAGKLLSKPNEELEMVRNNARQKCVESGYSYFNRAKEVSEELMEIIRT